LNEVITKHIEQALVDNQDVALAGCPFQVLFTADKDSNVKINVRWPVDDNVQYNGEIIARMLESIFSTEWLQPTIDAVQRFAVSNKQKLTATNIMQRLNELQQERNIMNQVCVRPLEVFHKTQK
jgi:hypothetical protein